MSSIGTQMNEDLNEARLMSESSNNLQVNYNVCCFVSDILLI